MVALKISILLLTVSITLASNCGGNCPGNNCPNCICGTSPAYADIAGWCANYNGWS
jgi:hypothetical protein